MTADRCVNAYTPATPTEPGVYVEFINITEMADGRVRFTIRQRGDYQAPYAVMYMEKTEAIRFLKEAAMSLEQS